MGFFRPWHDHHAVVRVDGIAVLHAAVLEQRRGHERLGGRSGLERLGDHRRRRLARIETAARHREDLTGVRIENDDVAALGAHARDRVGERLLGDLLQVGVDREHDVVALRRRACPARSAIRGSCRACRG